MRTVRIYQINSFKEIEMNSNLNVRKPVLLTLAFLLAVAMLLISLTNTTGVSGANAAKSQQNVLVNANDPQTVSIRGNLQPNPRVKFASLSGTRNPAALDGRRSPAALEGKRLPPSAIDGRKLPPSALDGRKLPPSALDGRKLPPSALEGVRNPAAMSNLPAIEIPSLALVDGLILLVLAVLLIAPARKTSALRS
jgi:hypothetical protein